MTALFGPRVDTQPYVSPPAHEATWQSAYLATMEHTADLEATLHMAEVLAEIRAGVAQAEQRRANALDEMLTIAQRERDLANQRVADLETVLRKREATI